jgi:hypothetical protein
MRSTEGVPVRAVQQLVKRGVNVLAGDPLLHLRVDLQRRLRVRVADLVHHVRKRRAGLEHQADVRAAERVWGDLRQRGDPALGTDLIRAVDDRRKEALADAVLVSWSAVRRCEHELVDVGRLPLGAPGVQLLDQDTASWGCGREPNGVLRPRE